MMPSTIHDKWEYVRKNKKYVHRIMHMICHCYIENVHSMRLLFMMRLAFKSKEMRAMLSIIMFPDIYWLLVHIEELRK